MSPEQVREIKRRWYDYIDATTNPKKSIDPQIKWGEACIDWLEREGLLKPESEGGLEMGKQEIPAFSECGRLCFAKVGEKHLCFFCTNRGAWLELQF